MPALKHQIAAEPQVKAATPTATAPVPAPVPAVVSMGAPVAYADSPARILHERLADHFEAKAAPHEERWSGAARVSFILGVSVGLWALIGGAVGLVAWTVQPA